MNKQGVQIGLKDLHYAKMTQDDKGGVSYETPKIIAGAIQGNINPNSSSATLFADDGPAETTSTIGEISLELNVKDLPLDIQADLLGHAINGGVMVRKTSDVAPYVAIGFRSEKSNGSYKYVWLLKGKFREPERSHQTKSNEINYQTPTINGNFLRRDYDEAWMKDTDEDHPDFVQSIADNWFTAVDDTPDTTAPTVQSVTPVDGASSVALDSTVVWTFDKAIQASNVTAANFFVLDAADTVVAGSLSINSDRTQVTWTPNANMANSTEHRAIVTTGVRDLAGNALASPSVTTFTTVV
ncbi:MAG: hypothetical protein FH756_01535 [Firmicutes bacterium]|nr:hypothetical protein [Bacillota bacterium]